MDSINGPWIHGFAIKGVGSLIGDRPVAVGPLGKINFLVGRNNHGKSTLLRQARYWVIDQQNRRGIPYGLGAQDGLVSAATLVPVSKGVLRDGRNRFGGGPEGELIAKNGWEEIDADRFGVWVDRIKDPNPYESANKVLQQRLGFAPSRNKAYSPAYAAGFVLIPAFRELRRELSRPAGKQGPDLASGEGLIAELATWERPVDPESDEYDAARARWIKLQSFLRDVLEDPDADIEVANNKTDLHVQLAQAGRMLKIDNLGDGIKQILMIAAACVYFDGSFVCLEEPEIHLHAGLQRKLLRFLAEQTNSQYLIATHSAHVLDLPDARIFHVTHDGEKTKVSPAVRASEVQQVCQDLGYMASDLLQANYVIWVEGPSDRIYWRRWLELVDPDLEEGVHFTIMVYGGYLLEELRTDPEDVPDVADIEDDLIHLLKLGRACTVITDSDKASAAGELRLVVQRLKQEADLPGSGAIVVCEWVRTVENLIPRSLFRDTVIELHQRAGKRLRTETSHGPFDQPFDGMKRGSYSKVRVAQAIARKLSSPDIGAELLEEVTSLAGRVREANGLPSIDR